MLPCRFILINQQAFKGVLELSVVPVNDILMLHINVHQFKGVVTETIVQSFDVNSSNRNFFSALPLEKISYVELSLNQSEELFLYIQNMLSRLTMSDQLHKLVIIHLVLFLKYDQIFKMNNFINQFITTYELVRMNLVVIQNKQIQQSISTNVTNYPIETEQPIVEDIAVIEVENPENSTEISLLNDCLLMSPNILTTYFISKQISSILNQSHKEKIHFEFNKQSVTIHISPLIHQELIEVSDDHYTDLINIISSFNYTQEEYITKLRFLVRHLIYIINNYVKSNNSFFITVKIIEFLILIYTIKLSPSSLISNINTNSDANSAVQAFKESIQYLVNYAIQHIITHHIDQRQLTHNEIIFKHYPNIEYFEDEFNSVEIRQLLSKELYLMDVDKEFFINQVITKVNKKSTDIKSDNVKLIFNKSINIDIKKILESEPLNNGSWLDYQLINPQQKQFDNHTIITKDYLQLLQMNNIPNFSKALIKDIHPILTKYANIIINFIFKELSTCDTKHSISTLYLLTVHIRPYLHKDATNKTEMYILYRIVIPYLYDIFKINLFIDYFH